MGLTEILKRRGAPTQQQRRRAKAKRDERDANERTAGDRGRSTEGDGNGERRCGEVGSRTTTARETLDMDVKREVSDADVCEAVEDLFERHVSTVLPDAEARRLKETATSYRPWSSSLAKVCVSPSASVILRVQEIWPNVIVETSTDVDDGLIKSSLSQCGIRPSLQRTWRSYHTERGQRLGDDGFVDAEQRCLLSLFSHYKNVFYNMKRYPTKEEGYDHDVTLDAAVLHCVNHVSRAKQRLQDRIERQKWTKLHKKQAKIESSDKEHKMLKEDCNPERILGFTFPKVLILVPMRNAAFNVVQRILKLAAPPDQSGLEKVMEKLRTNYGPDEALEAALKKQKKSERSKPPDYEALFYGHVADTVTIGIKMHLNGELSVFRPLPESDFFIASPLSLSLLLEKKEQEVTDTLSSIEIVLIERAEVLLMQNWQHVVRVMHHLNQMPKETPQDVNLQHVRRHFLHQQGSLFRQNIVLSAFASAEMQSLFNGPLCRGHAGSVRFRPIYPNLLRRAPKHRTLHRFERHACASVEESADARFAYFRSSWLEKIRTSAACGILLFVPQFFDFVRVCDVLTSEGIRHVALSEYTGQLKSKKLRKQFRDGDVRVLVTTERYYFYNRPRMKGVREVLFYALPEHPQFYGEIMDSIDAHPVRVTVQYSRFSSLQLERIVGSEKARHWLQDRAEVATEALG